jgi:hypothetical protein
MLIFVIIIVTITDPTTIRPKPNAHMREFRPPPSPREIAHHPDVHDESHLHRPTPDPEMTRTESIATSTHGRRASPADASSS